MLHNYAYFLCPVHPCFHGHASFFVKGTHFKIKVITLVSQQVVDLLRCRIIRKTSNTVCVDVAKSELETFDLELSCFIYRTHRLFGSMIFFVLQNQHQDDVEFGPFLKELANQLSVNRKLRRKLYLSDNFHYLPNQSSVFEELYPYNILAKFSERNINKLIFFIITHYRSKPALV